MPGNLARYLQEAFCAAPPAGWSCEAEVPLLDAETEAFLGYKPKADVVLSRREPARRIWVEFEVSRADPVANHVKFAATHILRPWPEGDAFVSMASAHIARGRRNLCSSAVLLMRSIGMQAFQTVLLPGLEGKEVKRINHLPLADIGGEGLPVRDEVERLLCVSETWALSGGHRIHFAADPFEVMVNVRAWNEAVAGAEGRDPWGRRTVQYFVFDPSTERFAPSKFCAFVPVDPPGLAGSRGGLYPCMTLDIYASLDESETRFDGRIAWRHLVNRLGFERREMAEHPYMTPVFEKWLASCGDCVRVHPRGPVILMPPAWFVRY